MSNVKLNQCTVTLTRDCNLRCNFCYAKKTNYVHNDTLEYDKLKQIVDFCDEAQIKYIVFTGGEPSVYPKLLDILEYIKQKHNKIIPTIATNGIMLKNYDYCKALVDKGIEYIDISLKGKDRQQCIALTGRDCYEEQLLAIRNTAKLGIDFTCSMVLTFDNILTFCDTVKTALANGGKQFSFTFVIDNEKSELQDLEYLKKNNPLKLIDTFISQIDKLNAITDEWWIEYSFPMCMYTQEQLDMLQGRLAAPCQVHYRNAVTFDTKMNLLPCNMFLDDKLGQFGKDFSSFAEFERYTDTELYKTTMTELGKNPSEECSSCRYFKACLGGCPVLWKNYSYEALKAFKMAWLEKV